MVELHSPPGAAAASTGRPAAAPTSNTTPPRCLACLPCLLALLACSQEWLRHPELETDFHDGGRQLHVGPLRRGCVLAGRRGEQRTRGGGAGVWRAGAGAAARPLLSRQANSDVQQQGGTCCTLPPRQARAQNNRRMPAACRPPARRSWCPKTGPGRSRRAPPPSSSLAAAARCPSTCRQGSSSPFALPLGFD